MRDAHRIAPDARHGKPETHPRASATALIACAFLAGCSAAGGTGPDGVSVGSRATSTTTKTSTTTSTGELGSAGMASAPSKTGKAVVVYIPNVNNASVTDYSNNLTTQVNQSFATTTGGSASSTASATFDGKLVYNTSVLGTGVMNRAGSAPDSAVQSYSNTTTMNGGVMLAMGTSSLVAADVLQDSTYGLVMIGKDPAELALGGYHAGNLTPTSQLPVFANYVGQFVGYDFKSGADLAATPASLITGNTAMSANFAAGTVSGTVSNVTTTSRTGAVVAMPYGIAFDGTISGSSYTGQANFTNPSGAAPPAPTSSALNGAFYGANAAETAAAMRIQGLAPAARGGTIDTVVVGSFGAKKQ